MSSKRSPLPPIAPLTAPQRRRGGQPGNHNARAHGHYSRLSPSSSFLSDLQHFKRAQDSRALPLQLALASAGQQCDRLDQRLDQAADQREYIALLDLRFKISSIHTRLLRELAAIARPRMELLQQARDPLAFIRSSFHYRGITRDADSFLSHLERSGSRSTSPALSQKDSVGFADSIPLAEQPYGLGEHTRAARSERAVVSLPFQLTDEQWSLLEPLIPPDPADDHYAGEPPALIAANRWRFADTIPGRRASSAALREYRRLTAPYILHEEPRVSRKGSGRPTFSPRPVLDAIFYKLSTGCSWTEFPASGHPARIADTQPVGAECPAGYPSWRTCQVYYRRLFNSGRLYTLLLALYHHLRTHSKIDPVFLVESGRLTLDDRGKVIAASSEPLTWELQTSLLFVQLAHAAARRVPASSASVHPSPVLRPRSHSFSSTRAKSTLNSLRPHPRLAPNEPESSDLLPWSPSLAPPSDA